MKKLAYLFLTLTLFSCNNENEPSNENEKVKGELSWSKTYGGTQDEYMTGVVKTNDGGFIVLGYTQSNDGDVIKSNSMIDIWLSKYDSSGNLVWSKTIGGSNNDYGTSIIPTKDGNFVIAGYSASNDGDVPGNLGMHDFYVCKINNNGDILWSKNYGFMSHDHAHKIIETQDGGFFVGGYADYAGIEGTPGDGNHGEGHSLKGNKSSAKHGVGEYFGIRLDSNGNFKWYRYFGGTQNDRINDIVEANDGGFVLVGYSESVDFDITNNKGSYDYWILKLDASGHLHWKKNFGGTGIDQANSVAKTDNNSYMIVGRSNSTDGDISKNIGNFDAWVIHVNDHGELLWEKSFGSPEFDAANTIKKLKNGSFGIVGSSRGNIDGTTNKGQNDYWIFEIDNRPNTSIHWQKTVGGDQIDIANDFIQTEDGFVIIGDTQSNTNDVPSNKGANDLWMVKIQ